MIKLYDPLEEKSCMECGDCIDGSYDDLCEPCIDLELYGEDEDYA